MQTQRLLYLGFGIIVFILQIIFVAGGHAIWNRALLRFFGIPYDEGVAVLQSSGMFSRIVGLSVFQKKGLVNWKKALWFLPGSAIAGAIGGYLIISISEIYFTLIISLFLIGSFLTRNSTGWIPNTQNKVIGYGLFFLVEIFGTVTGGGSSALLRPILSRFFDIGALELVGIRKVLLSAKHIPSLLVILTATKFNWILFGIITPCAMLGSYVGSHYFIGKGDKFTEEWIGYTGLVLGIFMLGTALYTLFG